MGLFSVRCQQIKQLEVIVGGPKLGEASLIILVLDICKFKTNRSENK